jgi:hypothetical protein
MILTPFATASTITTFSDGSSEVIIEFKDGVNNENTTDGGFYVPSGETITSASVDIVSTPMLYSTSDGVKGVRSYSWDPNQNNGATTISNPGKFTFSNTLEGDEIKLSSEVYTSDFEYNESGMTNESTYLDANGEFLTWDYDYINFKQLDEGPDYCASGEMCWGTNFFDTDYTNDNDPLAPNPRYEYRMKTPTLYLDNSINDTYLRFSSWHQLETKFNQQGDYYYDDCAFVEIEYSTTGQFLGEESIANLPINFPLSNGISPGQGAYFVSDSSGIGNTVTPECIGVDVNQYALAGTSITPQNPQGWSTVASNLAPYLGYYVKLNFVLYHAGQTGNLAPGPSPGWFIDDVTVGERYNQDGVMVINNIQPPTSYDDKSANGYGLFFADVFEPGESSLEYTFRNSINGVVITATDGTLMQGLTGPLVELWNIDVDQHPFIDVEIKFDSGPEKISTPSFHGYSFGTEFGITFNDLKPYRNFTINQGNMQFEHDSDPKSNSNVIYYNSTDFMANIDGYGFSKPIYGFGVFDIPALCNSDVKINHAHITTPIPIPQDTVFMLDEPIFDIDFTIELNSDCDIENIWFNLVFGEHFENIQLDFGADGEYEWELAEPAFGKFGLQHNFYSGEVNGISQSATDRKLVLDPITGEVIDGFFLIPKSADIEYFNFEIVSNSIFNRNNTEDAFKLVIVVGTNEKSISFVQNSGNQLFSETVENLSLSSDFLSQFIGDANTPVIKTDDSGIDWVRVGFKITQRESNGGSVTFQNLRVIYSYNSTLDDSVGFGDYLRQTVAILGQEQGASAQSYIPLISTSQAGGQLHLANLEIETEQGYDSTLDFVTGGEGLYQTGEIYHFRSTHSVQAGTGANLESARLQFKGSSDSFYLGYDLSTGFYELDDNYDYVSLHPSSGVISLPDGGIQVDWKFTVNGAWDDEKKLIILSETLADNGVIGMLSGISLEPDVGNAIENDILINNLTLYNSAGVEQQLIDAYSSQVLSFAGNVTLEGLNIAPSPTSYNMVVEVRGTEIDGQFSNITWTEIANTSGFIGGSIDWNVNLGLFASGSDTYRFRITNYDGGEVLCPPVEYGPDSDCGIQFNLSVDILSPNLLSFELYKRSSGVGDINSDDNWRDVFDDSWATPKLQQDFRVTVSDVPTPPESAVVHAWIEYDHDLNSNGVAEESEYIQIPTTNTGITDNASFIGTYNDMANSGLKGRVSIWVECYDLAGNSVDGGGPGFDNDYVTYVSMDLEYPTIKSLNIENSFGERMLQSIPSNAPDGVGIWNQTMFAGNEYNVVIDASDGNGWKDVEYVELTLAPQESNYDSTIIYYPRNQTVWTESDMFTISSDASGDTKATIRNTDGNVLIDPFEEDFVINIPISLKWGLPLSGDYTPAFKIKDLDNSPVFSESSFRQNWIYQNDMRLDFRSDLDNKQMISPTLTDQDIPISENLYHEIGQTTFIGSVTGGDTVMFSGQYSFTSGILENVFITPEVELTMEITRKEVFRDSERDYDPVEEEITTHTFTSGKFDIPIKMPSYQNEFEYEFKLINLPVGAEDLTTAYCFGSVINGCGKFVIKVDDEPPKLVFGSWSASRGETASNGLEPELYDTMPTSTYHCVDVSSQIEERGNLADGATTLNWIYYNGNPADGNVWNVYQNNYGTNPLSTPLDLSAGSLGYIRASADCVDLWPVGFGQFDVTESNLNQPGLEVNLVVWIKTVDGAGSPIIGAGRYFDDGSAAGIEGNDNDGQDSSTYTLEFEGSKFEVRNTRTIPDSPTVGDKITLEVELINSGIPGVADLEIRSVTNNQPPVFEGYIVSEIIGKDQAQWVTIELEEFTDATTGMYYIVYDNETKDVLFNGKDQGKTFNVKVSSASDSGISTSLIVIILIGVIAILAVVVVVISRRDRGDDFDDEFETDYEEDKSYASIPAQPQTYNAPAAAVSPEMAEALEKFNFWTQEEIQGYFDQGWSIQQLEEWLENQ